MHQKRYTTPAALALFRGQNLTWLGLMKRAAVEKHEDSHQKESLEAQP